MANNRKGKRLSFQVQMLAQPLASCVTSVSLLILSVPNFLICINRYDHRPFFTGSEMK